MGVILKSDKSFQKKLKYILPIVISILLLAFLLLNRGLFLGESSAADPDAHLPENDRKLYFLLTGVLIFISAVHCFVSRRFLRNEDRSTNRPARIYYGLLFAAVNAWVSFWLIEIINNPDYYELTLKFRIIGYMITLVGYLVLIGLTNSITVGVLLGNVFFLVWGIADYFVYLFRRMPLQFIDLYAIETAMTVVGKYKFQLTWQIVMAVVAAVTMVLICANEGLLLIFKNKIGRILIRVGALALAGVFYIVVFKTSFMDDRGVFLHQWNPQLTYTSCGMEAGFLTFAKNSLPEEPEGYSAEKVSAIIAGTEAEPARTESEIPENLIVIMNESFSDLSLYPGLKTSGDVLPYFHSLTENTIKGPLLMSVFGAVTPNSEYEFLTGNSCLYSPTTAVYNSFIKQEQYGLTSVLKKQGYRTVAMHPMLASNWNRNNVYPLMGFDEFVDEDGYEDPEYLRDYVSDKADYERIFQEVEEKEEGEKLFIFNVTIQNHGGYKYGGFTPEIRIEGYDGDFLAEAEQYETLMHISDEALSYLIDYFEKCDQKTMIVLFGDHQPAMSDDFFNYLYGKDASGLTFDEQQMRYRTNYLIWANYDIPEGEGPLLSANLLGSYALSLTGLSGSRYNSYLMNLMEKVPAVNAYGYETADGTMHEHGSGDDPEAESLLSDYECLIYNELTAGKGRDAAFFGLADER
ncbi:MAG: LTA synthase family protein [Bacteroidales bacterium]|nr:LTA synthase family protein [Bacteroidales bacterium]